MARSKILAGLALVITCQASALDFHTTVSAAILYNAPSREADKLAVVGSGVPLEVLVQIERWNKVRDYTGRLAWLEKSALGNTRIVLVTASEASVRQQPQAQAEAVFRAARGLLLEVQDTAGNGWIKVRHADGLTGWLRQTDVWGE